MQKSKCYQQDKHYYVTLSTEDKMFSKIVELNRDYICSKLESLDFVRIDDLIENEALPQTYRNMIIAERDIWIFKERLKLSSSPFFQFGSSEADFFEYENFLKKSAVVPFGKVEEFIESLVKLRVNFLCRPRTTLRYFIFKESLTVSINEFLKYFAFFQDFECLYQRFYEHIATEINSGKSHISIYEFDNLIEEFDLSQLYELDADSFVTLISPMFDLFSIEDPDDGNRQVPAEALILFFDDKKLRHVASKIENSYKGKKVTIEQLLLLLEDALSPTTAAEFDVSEPINTWETDMPSAEPSLIDTTDESENYQVIADDFAAEDELSESNFADIDIDAIELQSEPEVDEVSELPIENVETYNEPLEDEQMPISESIEEFAIDDVEVPKDLTEDIAIDEELLYEQAAGDEEPFKADAIAEFEESSASLLPSVVEGEQAEGDGDPFEVESKITNNFIALLGVEPSDTAIELPDDLALQDETPVFECSGDLQSSLSNFVNQLLNSSNEQEETLPSEDVPQEAEPLLDYNDAEDNSPQRATFKSILGDDYSNLAEDVVEDMEKISDDSDHPEFPIFDMQEESPHNKEATDFNLDVMSSIKEYGQETIITDNKVSQDLYFSNLNESKEDEIR